MTQVRIMHASMEHGDTTAAKQHDARAVFDRAVARDVAWITGTEAGYGAGSDMRDVLKNTARNHHYRFHIAAGDVWIAVQDKLVAKKTWKKGWIETLPASTGSLRFSTRGLIWVQFTTPTASLGQVSVGCAHYQTHGSKPGEEYYDANTKLTRVIGDWGKEHGAGRAICFFGGDTNISDRHYDVFRGQPFTTAADELKAWQDSGHGSIDVIASYDADGRVKAQTWNVLDDKEFQLYTDHYLCEATYEVAARAGKG